MAEHLTEHGRLLDSAGAAFTDDPVHEICATVRVEHYLHVKIQVAASGHPDAIDQEAIATELAAKIEAQHGEVGNWAAVDYATTSAEVEPW